MSLVNENDLIIPGTFGIIYAAAKEANRHLDQRREHAEFEESKNKNIAEYIREIPKIQFILQNRVNGIPLEQLVNPARISNNRTRVSVSKQETIEEQSEKKPTQRASEDWFRG